MNLKGKKQKKIGLITGSTSGLGKAVAEYLAHQGFFVGINGRDYEKTKKISDENSHYFPLAFDTTDFAACLSSAQKLSDMFGEIDFIICNVGGGSIPKNYSKQQRIEIMIKLNLISAYNVVEAFESKLKDFYGQIIVISSIATSGKTDAPIEYVVAKSALNSYGMFKSKILSQRGVTVNLVSPGNLMFPGSVWDSRLRSNPDTTLDYIKSRVPLGRFIDPIEIAELIHYLLERNMPNATGNNFIVDGGQSL